MLTYACDFETTTENTFNKEGKVRVWAWQARNIEDTTETITGTSIESFMSWVLTGPSKDLYFHNLKYDGGYIIDWLERNGWQHILDREYRAEGTYETLITELGQFFTITIYRKVYARKTVRVRIMDSLKKLPMGIERIANTFDLPVKKGEIDYHAYRPEGHELTKEEREYLDNDTFIMAEALKQQFNAGLDKLTIAGDAFNNYKQMLGRERFNYLFPVLPLEIDDFIRASYKGGFVYVKPEKAGLTYEKTTSYDVNSLYPSVMYYKSLPFGKPVKFEGEYEYDERYPLYIQKVRVMFELKKDHIPTIQAKNNLLYKSTEYLTKTKEMLDLYLTNIDLQLLFDHHEVHYIEFLGGLKFRASTGLFEEYIDHWSHIKETTTGGERELAKLMLNSLYGRFAMSPERRRKIPFFDKEKDKVRYELHEDEAGKPTYTAMSSFITAYAREITIRDAQANYDRFIYADTDSIHLEGWEVPENLKIHDTKLGYWACEGLFGKSKFLRPKTYIKYNEKDELEITCAGLPEEARDQVTFENFELGAVYQGKLTNKVVPGGSLLVETTYRISIPE